MFKFFCKLGFHDWSKWKIYYYKPITDPNKFPWMRRCNCCGTTYVVEFEGDPNE